MKSSDLRYAHAQDDALTQALRRNAADYFSTQHEHRWANGWFWLKAALLIGGAATSYGAALSSATASGFAMLYIGFILCSMLLAMNLLHDAAHRAVFRSPALNRWLNRVIALPLGIDPDYWTVRHVHYHHVHPNVEGLDLDIEANFFLRQTPFHPYHAHFRFQHGYWPLIAALSLPYINWVYDWSDRLGQTPIAHEKVLDGWRGWLIFICGKLTHMALTLGLPMLLLPQLSSGFIVAIYFAAQLVASFFVVAMILGTHWADVEFFLPAANGRMPHTWVAHSLYTAVDWQPRPTGLTYWLGGLNLHLTHHLFPTINHRHYPALAKIVQRTALAHGVPYRSISYRTLLQRQQQFLRRMGQAPSHHTR
ncbi:MAG: fatty acid desaturase family protein [Formosimonas sp.]